MTIIKPVSDLRNYNEVLKDVKTGNPVYLTRNGRGCYVIVDIEEYERREAIDSLMNELEKGRKSGDEQGWIPFEKFSAALRDENSED